ncbi:hypothetical protein [Pseudoduganella buxea]|uniref:L,D-transpeptidase n=1 Tax=Pseudoduganella buxea TaxID=1949069 RepID=A0A6I3SWV4_9BURK|nr:hypothetical protein [Pseudoduganella buxea]MTV53771.1 hypothetical protein [Pseudoduganella buxea]GGC01815.1 hypothetical protein GCM10011572_24690 [Pseudoduganella buxea]
MNLSKPRTFGATLASRVGLGCLAAVVAAMPALASDTPAGAPGHAGASASAGARVRADFGRLAPSADVRRLADWILAVDDHRRLPFLIVDKKQATAYAFHADGILRGAAPILLGLAIGDDSVPGIGQRSLSAIRPEERTTPAGRFVAALDRNLHGKEILWVDYDAAISLHRVVTGVPKERRAERLASPTPLDNRVSYGCINVPKAFFDGVVVPAFKGTNGIVYVLPETRSAHAVFGSYDVDGQR